MLARTLCGLLLLLLSLSLPLAWWQAVSGRDMVPPLGSNGIQMTNAPRASAQIAHELFSNGRYAYRPRASVPATANEAYDRYLAALDPQRMFLTSADRTRLKPSVEALVAALKGQDLRAPIVLYHQVYALAQQRVAFAQTLVERNFDFSTPETWKMPGDHPTWPADQAASDEAWRAQVKGEWLRLRLAGQDDATIRATLRKRYARWASQLRQGTDADATAIFLSAYGATLDPHTSYLAPVAADNFAMQMSLSLEGIGAVLQMQDDGVVIRSLVPGGPAAASGQLKPGDRILAVGQAGKKATDVVGWRVDDVVKLVRGPEGSTVSLSVLAPGATGPAREIQLTRARVDLEDQAAQGHVVKAAGRRVGVVSLPAFYLDFEGRRAGRKNARSATADVGRLLAGFCRAQVDAVVMDLRGNGGGSLTEAVELVGLFIGTGPVVQIRNSRGQVELESDRDPGVAWAGPLTVLVDRQSASAAEIFAASVQDYGRGLVIGEPTYGKGTVQTLIDLDEVAGGAADGLGQVKLTVAQFFRISGGTTQRDGVRPDIAFPVTLNGDKAGEGAQDNALPPGRVEPARFSPVKTWAGALPKLRQKHARRTAENPQWGWWAEDVRTFRAERDRASLSLNERTRRQELAAKARVQKDRAAQRRRLGLPQERVFADDGLYESERAPLPGGDGSTVPMVDDVLLIEAVHIAADTVRL